jgi:hypothetical protein
VDIDQLAPNEPLSPELVLVLPAELRAQVLADLGPPVWPRPRPRVRPAPPPPTPAAADDAFARSIGRILVARVAQLAAIFVLVTILVLAMTLVANATQSEKRPQMTPIRAPIDKAAKAGRSDRSAPLVGRYREGTWKPA